MSDVLDWVRRLRPDVGEDLRELLTEQNLAEESLQLLAEESLQLLAEERRSLMAFIEATDASAAEHTVSLPVEQRIVPQLAYADLDTALPWLARTFGFSEREEARFHNPDGTVGHAEMWAFGDVHFMLGSHGGHGLSSPRGTASGSQMLCIYVDDVEAHFRRAREEGATIRAEIADKPWGDRSYEADDLEGHRWAFCQKMRVVDPQDWHSEE